MQNKKGFISLIAILIVIIVAAFWMLYLFKREWFGANNLNLSGGLTNAIDGNNAQTPKDITGQLDNLRQNVKTIQDKKDREILDELNK
jgi:uncharacterized membrane protein YraQ (UPF0718 family)